jgi:hypothetical protein
MLAPRISLISAPRRTSASGRFDQFAKRSMNDPYWRKPVIAGMGAIDVKGSISQAIAPVQLSVNLCRG